MPLSGDEGAFTPQNDPTLHGDVQDERYLIKPDYDDGAPTEMFDPLNVWLTSLPPPSTPSALTPPRNLPAIKPSPCLSPIDSTDASMLLPLFFESPPSKDTPLSPFQLISPTMSPLKTAFVPETVIGSGSGSMITLDGPYIVQGPNKNDDNLFNRKSETFRGPTSPLSANLLKARLEPPPTQRKKSCLIKQQGAGSEAAPMLAEIKGVWTNDLSILSHSPYKAPLVTRLFTDDYCDDEPDNGVDMAEEGNVETEHHHMDWQQAPSDETTTHTKRHNQETFDSNVRITPAPATKVLCFGSASLPAGKSVLLDKVLRGCVANFLGPRPPREWMNSVASLVGVTNKQVESKWSNIRQRNIDRDGRPKPMPRDTSSLIDEASAAAVVARLKTELKVFTEQLACGKKPCLDETALEAAATAATAAYAAVSDAAAGADPPVSPGFSAAFSMSMYDRTPFLRDGGNSAMTTVAASSTARQSHGGRERALLTPVTSIAHDLMASDTNGTKLLLSSTKNNADSDSMHRSNIRNGKTKVTKKGKSGKPATAAAADLRTGRMPMPTPAQLRQVAEETGLGLQEVLNVLRKVRAVGGETHVGTRA